MSGRPADSRPRAWQSAALVGAGAVLLAIWHFASIDTGHRLVRALHSAAHFPVFGLFAAVVFALLHMHSRGRLGRTPWIYLATFLVMVVVSLLAEGLQMQLDNRHGSLRDVGVNLLGTTAALSLLALREPGIGRMVRPLSWLVAIACAAIVAAPVVTLGAAYAKRALDFPVLARFNHSLDMLHIEGTGVRFARTSLPDGLAEPGEPPSLCVEFRWGPYPGITFPDPVRNWEGYRELQLNLSNPQPQPVLLVLRIDDAAHDGRHHDRLNHVIELPGETRQTVSIPMPVIRDAPDTREMQLDRIRKIIIFSGEERSRGREFCLSWIRLAP